jgi:hypothetical protein
MSASLFWVEGADIWRLGDVYMVVLLLIISLVNRLWLFILAVLRDSARIRPAFKRRPSRQ